MRKKASLAFIACILICCATASSGDPGSGDGANDAGFVKESCECQCNGKPLKSVGIYKPGSILGITNPLEDKAGTAKAKCEEQCAKTCGGRTDCPTAAKPDCTECCDDFCTSKYSGGSGTSTEAGKTPTDLCKASCQSTCKFKKTVNGITEIVYMIAGIIGALMIAIHGIRMVTSQDPHDREAAKSSIFHVIVALIIIALAAALVNMFITMGGLEI